ncbi:MAG: Hsp20/alpha crystallin family protein [Methanotrichaceae archaeon]
MANKEDVERMIGRAIMVESIKRSAQAHEIFRKVFGDLVENIPQEGYDTPTMDLVDTPEEIVVFVDLPGTDKENINLEITEDAIIVGAKTLQPEGKYLHKERSVHNMKRKIKLSEEIKPEQVRAKYENGVLEVHLPKLIVVKPHIVNIE